MQSGDIIFILDQLKIAYDTMKEIKEKIKRKNKKSQTERSRRKWDTIMDIMMHFAKCFEPNNESQLMRILREIRNFWSMTETEVVFSQFIDASMIQEALVSYFKSRTKGPKNLKTFQGVEIADENRRKIQLQKDEDDFKSRIKTDDVYITIAEIFGSDIYIYCRSTGRNITSTSCSIIF